MKNKSKIYRIPSDQLSEIRNNPDKFGIEVIDFQIGNQDTCWVDDATIEMLEVLGIEPTILEEEEVLPVFHLAIDTAKQSSAYDSNLTFIAPSADPRAVAVIYVGDYWQYDPVVREPLDKWSKHFIDFPPLKRRWLVLPPPGSGEADDMARWVYQDLHKWNEGLKAFLVDLGFDLE